MQKRLILMRHGHAEEGRDDYVRRLTDAGRSAARRAGLALAHAGFSPEHVLTSPAPRAHETAELVAEACEFAGPLQAERALYTSEENAYLAALRGLPEQVSCVLLVGHNPTASALARKLGPPGGDLRPAEYVDLRLELDAWLDL
jgi:phosphohistidine phosphatase